MGIPQEENILPRGGFNSNPAAPNRQEEEYPFPISNGPEAEDLYSELASALHPGNNYIMNMRAGRGRVVEAEVAKDLKAGYLNC